MTDTIRTKVDEIAPALLGANNRTLSDIYDVLYPRSADHAELMSLLVANHTELMTKLGALDTLVTLTGLIETSTTNINTALGTTNTLLGLVEVATSPLADKLDAIALSVAPLDASLNTIALAVAPLDGKLETTNYWLDSQYQRIVELQAAIGAGDYGDLQLGTVRGFLHNANLNLAEINLSIGIGSPPEPLQDVRTYLSMIAESTNTTVAELTVLNDRTNTGNSLIGDVITELGDLDVSVLAGNSILSGIDINIGSGNDAVVQTILDTSGSVRGEIVALKEQDATNHGEAQAQLITIAEQAGLSRAELEVINVQVQQIPAINEMVVAQQTQMLTSAISGQTTALTGALETQTAAIGAMTEAQTAAIDALFQAYLYSDGDDVTVAQRLYQISYMLSFVATEFGWSNGS